jgi:hypothetical protein
MSNKTPAQKWQAFDPRDYLEEYYADVGAENFALLKFIVRAFIHVPRDIVLLDFGGGPTIYPLIAAVHKAKEIHVCDYVDAHGVTEDLTLTKVLPHE